VAQPQRSGAAFFCGVRVISPTQFSEEGCTTTLWSTAEGGPRALGGHAALDMSKIGARKLLIAQSISFFFRGAKMW
jgi:hypothetical protein